MSNIEPNSNALTGDSADQLRAYVVLLQKVETQQDVLNKEKSRIYREAKACGFCKSTIRKLVLRLREGQGEADAKLDQYTEIFLAIDTIDDGA